jgi:hypothetical protein
MGFSPSEGFDFLLFRQREAVHKKQNVLPGGPRRLSVRAVNGAGSAFIGAKRRPLTEKRTDQAQLLARKDIAGEDSYLPCYRLRMIRALGFGFQ